MSTINELLRLFITYESRGSDQIYREWKDLEKQGARVEENLGGVEKKFDDIGDASEANAKKSESSLQKMGKAIGGVQKQHEDLARSQDTVRRSTEGLADAFGDLSKRSTAELKQIQASLKTLGDDQAAMRIGAEIDNRSFGVAKARIDAFKAGVAADDTHVEVKADYDSASFHGVEQGIQGVVSSIREVRTLAMGFSIVGIIAALGGAIPLAISLTGALARLATGIGAGLAGAAAIGGAAVAGAVGGLRAYGAGIAYVVSQAGQLPTNVASATSALSSATSAFQSAKDAVNSAKKGTDEYAQAQLQLQSATLQLQQAQTEYQRMQILNTAAARGFAAETQDSSIQLAKLQAAVGNNVFPYFTRELDYWNEEIGTFTPRIAATSGALAAVAAKFSEFIRTSRQGKTLTLFFNFLSRSALRAENAIFGLGVGATRILEYLIPPAARLQNSVVRLSMAFAAWAQSAKGTQQIAAAIGFLERRMYQVITIATDLGRAIFNIFAAVNRSTNMENILNPLVFGMRDFADATDKGSVGAQKITAFMNAAKPALQAVASLALEAARQILILADNVIRAGQSGGKIGTLAQVINSVKASLAPIRVLLQNTFIQLGPALAKLIPEVVKFASAFLGSSNVLVAFVNRITGLLHLFNSLPPGVKSVVIEMVALNSIMSGLGGPTILGLLGSLSRLIFSYRLMNTQGKILAATTTAEGNAVAATTLKQRIAAAATTAWSVASRVAAAATRGLGIAVRFMLGPWGLLIAAIALGVTLIITHWAQIRPALQPVINLFQRAWQVGKQLAQMVGAVLTGNLTKAAGIFHRLPASIQPTAMTMARVANAARQLALKGIAFLREQAAKVLSWWRANLPLLQRTASTVFNAIRRVVGTVIRFIWLTTIKPAITALVAFWRVNHKQIVSILKSAWQIIKTTVSATVRIIGNLIRAGMQAINGNWKGAWQSVKRALDIAWQAMKKIVQAALNIIKNVIKIAWNTVKSLTSAAFEAVKNYISDKIDAAKNKVHSTVEAIKNGLKSAWEDIKHGAEDAWSAISGFIWHPVETAYNKVKQFLGQIIGAVNKVLNAVGLDPIGTGGGSGGSGGNGSGTNTAGNPHSGSARVAAPRQFRFARGGLVGNSKGRRFAAGGISPPRTPQINLWGEGDHEEAFITSDPSPPTRRRNLGYLSHIAGKLGQVVVPANQRGGDFGGGRRAAKILRRGGPYFYRRFASGGLTEQDLNTYRSRGEAAMGHPYIYGPTGTHAGPDGYSCSGLWNWILSGSHAETGRGTYAYYNDQMGLASGPGQVEVGVTLSGAGGLDNTHMAGDVMGTTFESTTTQGVHHGAGAGAFPKVFHLGDPTDFAFKGSAGGGLAQAAFDAAWNRFVKPIVSRFLDPLKNGNIFAQIAGAGGQKVVDGIHDWIAGKINAVGGSFGAGGSNEENRQIGQKMVDAAGWSNQWSSFDQLAQRESGWDNTARNASSGAYGIPQALPESKLPPAGQSSGGSHADAQIGWMIDYIRSRYGDPNAAWAHSQSTGWYGRGGMAIGDQLMRIGEDGHDEVVIPLGDRRVERQVNQLFGIQALREEVAGLRHAMQYEGILVDRYGAPAEETIAEGYYNAPRRYMKSREARGDVERHIDRRDELERIAGGAG